MMANRRMVLGGAWGLAAALAAGLRQPVWAAPGRVPGPRRALIVGNAAYRHVPRLVNPARDARLIEATLGRLGIDCSCVVDATNAELSSVVDAFMLGLRRHPAEVAWFYFSGHGAYVDGRNLLLGVDTTVSSPRSLRAQGFHLDALRGMIEQANPGAAVLVEDACRNNPFVLAGEPSATRGLQGDPGLFPPRAWGGSLTAYSTAPFTQALDWPDRPHGPYATALAAALLRPGARPLEEVFREAADTVWASTRHRQQPGYYSDLREDVVVLGARSIELRPTRFARIAPDASSGGRSAGGAGPTHYQVDARAARPIGTPAAWQDDLDRLADAVRDLGPAQRRQAVARARRLDASPAERTLGAMLLEQRWPARHALDQAQRLYLRAARMGYVPAQVLLGELAARRGDDAQAYVWLNEASLAGSGRATGDLASLSMQLAAQGGPPTSMQDVRSRLRRTGALRYLERFIEQAQSAGLPGR